MIRRHVPRTIAQTTAAENVHHDPRSVRRQTKVFLPVNHKNPRRRIAIKRPRPQSVMCRDREERPDRLAREARKAKPE